MLVTTKAIHRLLKHTFFWLLSSAIINGLCFSADSNPTAIKQLIATKCLSCHCGDEAKGKLDLSSLETILRGGESGGAIVVNSPKDSLIWQRIEHDEMPPKHPLTDVEKDVFKDWISSGAVWSGGALDPLAFTTEHRAGLDWWSLQPIHSVRIPVTKSRIVRRQPIDDFVVEQLEERNLSMSPEADRRVLIRRVSFDLLGLPPSVDDVQQFLKDEQPDAFERLIDQYLASPHYGEKWARHWLDVVRFGESHGFERDLPRPNAWHYRDWVIAALNRDLPYDEFARHQLAADLFASDELESMKALGFLVAGAHNTVISVVDSMRATMRQDELEDMVGTIGQTFLGLTVNCARCHDHKFDPVTTKEYYQLASAFTGIDHGEREYFPANVARQLDSLQSQIDGLSKRLRDQETSLREAIVGDGLNAMLSEAEIVSRLSPDDVLARSALMKDLAVLKTARTSLAKEGVIPIYTAIVTQPSPMRIHQRGSVSLLGEEVSTSGIASVQGLSPNFGLRPDALESHRRRNLVNWITDPRNPLFRRTMVNRTWHYHFGLGLVDSPNDLGFHGGKSSHPDLLEWLCGEFKTFSLKQLHRLMVTSAAYRQSSSFNAQSTQVDSNDRYLWRKSPRRLEAEEVRDAMLSVAGQLNSEMGGKGYTDQNSYFFKGTQFYDPIDPVGFESHRRTIYRMWARGGRSPFLDTFDCPDPSSTTPRRSETVTPLQSLSLLNNSFSLRMADHFAERLVGEAAATPDAGIQFAFGLLYGRMPDAEELAISREFIARRGLSEYCRAMWNSSEFLFVD